MNICRKCVLPEYRPHIHLNSEGICNICEAEQKRKSLNEGSETFLESELIKILKKYRGNGKYDCLIACSGGKDSVLSLYYMKKRYRMNPLVFTFDHGFSSEDALSNIKNAVNILGTDWVFYKTDFIKDALFEIIRTASKATICHICAIWHTQLLYEASFRYNIPLIVAGWTKGQLTTEDENNSAYIPISEATREFVKNNLRKSPKYKNFSLSIRGVLKKTKKPKRSRMISPHWYLEKNPEDKIDILKKELKWRPPDLSYPRGSTNCLINFVNVYLAMKNYGYTHYHIEMSKLIRQGQLSREEALEKLHIDFDKRLIDSILKEGGYSQPDEKNLP